MAVKQSKRVETIDVRISKLPEDILCLTISFLPLREAARTSILSHRWRYLWRSYMKFSRSVILDFLAMKCDSGSTEMSSIYEDPQFWTRGRLRTERKKFIKWADKILQLGSSPMIDSFRIRFYMKKSFSQLINQWISVAIAKRVKTIDIDLSPFHAVADACPDGVLYSFPHQLFTKETCSLMKHLSLNSCEFQPPGCHVFSSLFEVQFEMVPISQDNIARFLSNCPNLEKLILVNCERLLSFEISGQSPKMKYLTIISYSVKKIQIDAINLIRFEYIGPPTKFSFPNVPQLSNVTYDFDWETPSAHTLEKFARDLPKLESLFIIFEPYKEDNIPRWLPVFTNLKKLVVKVIMMRHILWGFIPLIQASPHIESLELHLLGSAEFCQAADRPSMSPHLHLKEITLSGFQGTYHEIEFMTTLVSHTPALEKLTIVYEVLHYEYNLGFHVLKKGYTKDEWQRRAARVSLEKKEMEERVRMQFTNGFFTRVEIVFI